MTKRYLLLIAALMPLLSRGQWSTRMQYFDGADTNAMTVLKVITDSAQVWQIGKPQKSVFRQAATVPNALLTDTLLPYPASVNAAATVLMPTAGFSPSAIKAFRWKQKLDLDSGQDFAVVEYSVDSGQTWKNCFNNPYVYNFYGYMQANVGYQADSSQAFTGRDTTWRDIWLCFGYGFSGQPQQDPDTVLLRFRLVSDSVQNNRDGWMIDNIRCHPTFVHTVKTVEQAEKMRVFPTLTTGTVLIEGEKMNDIYFIESMDLIDLQGRVVKRYGRSPVKFSIDISDRPDGVYQLLIRTNKGPRVFRVQLQRT